MEISPKSTRVHGNVGAVRPPVNVLLFCFHFLFWARGRSHGFLVWRKCGEATTSANRAFLRLFL